MSRVYLSIGSNLGDRQKAIEAAHESIERHAMRIVSRSSIYETPAWGYDGNPYLNQVLEVETTLEPHDLLDQVLDIENHLGRPNRSGVYEDRIIDIDILFYDTHVLMAHDLVLPHPHLHERKFVLVPLNEIAPQLIHPVIGQRVAEMLDGLQDDSPIQVYSCATNT